VPVGVLREFAGNYQLTPNFAIVVTLAGDQLSGKAIEQPVFPIFSESTTEFFLKVIDAQISFEESSGGEVTGLVLHPGRPPCARENEKSEAGQICADA
jgi:hypothetical protein